MSDPERVPKEDPDPQAQEHADAPPTTRVPQTRRLAAGREQRDDTGRWPVVVIRPEDRRTRNIREVGRHSHWPETVLISS